MGINAVKIGPLEVPGQTLTNFPESEPRIELSNIETVESFAKIGPLLVIN